MSRRILAMICLVLPIASGFLCPSEEVLRNEPPRKPMIDSIVAGVNSVGEAGFWIYFRPDSADTGQDLREFEMLRRTSESNDSAFRRLFTGIAPTLRRVFDNDIKFVDSLVTYEYRILAHDSAIPAGVSEPSAPKSLRSCLAPRLQAPVNDTLLPQAHQFRWRVDFLYDGFIHFIGIAQSDSTIWSTQVTDPTPVVMMGSEYDTTSFLMTQETMRGTLPYLAPGRYTWWIRVIWQGSRGSEPAQSVAADWFRVQ